MRNLRGRLPRATVRAQGGFWHAPTFCLPRGPPGLSSASFRQPLRLRSGATYPLDCLLSPKLQLAESISFVSVDLLPQACRWSSQPYKSASMYLAVINQARQNAFRPCIVHLESSRGWSLITVARAFDSGRFQPMATMSRNDIPVDSCIRSA